MKKISNMEEQEILNGAYKFFYKLFSKKARSYSKKKYNSFNINPFTIRAAARTFGTNTNEENIAKAMVYPFALGSSLSTSFGTNVQNFLVQSKIASPSTTQGMDIEYIDAIDGRRKYCQLKAGPHTINKDDITTIENHFIGFKNLARTNHLKVQDNDYVLGVLYGDFNDLSTMYKNIYKDGIPVIAGQDFWYHLTGSKKVYQKLINQAQKASYNSGMQNSINILIQNTKKNIIKDKSFFGL